MTLASTCQILCREAVTAPRSACPRIALAWGPRKEEGQGCDGASAPHAAGAALRLLSLHTLHQSCLMPGERSLGAFPSPTTVPLSLQPRRGASAPFPIPPPPPLAPVAPAQGRTMRPVQASVQPRFSANPSPSGKSGAE